MMDALYAVCAATDSAEELSFFAKIWRAIVNFFRRLFGMEEISTSSRVGKIY